MITAEAWQWWQDQADTPASWTADHLSSRGLSAEHGYAPASWDGLVNHLRAQGFTEQQIIDAGVATTTRDGRTIDRFRDRLVMPVRSSGGRSVVAVTARANPDLEDPRTPKYINTPETALYSKRATLYGLDEEAIDALHHGARPVILEGPMDVAAIRALGRDDLVPVAPCGTALTPEQLDLLRANGADLSRAVVAFDADGAGNTAAAKAWELLEPSEAATARRLVLPAGADPADLIKDGRARDLDAALDASPNLTEALINQVAAGADLTTTESRVGLARLAATALARLPRDAASVDVVRDILSEHVDPETFDWLLAEALDTSRHDGQKRPTSTSGPAAQGAAEATLSTTVSPRRGPAFS
ncbi:toprim domain-containing protein [Salana multivorans]|uniref:toprim domain-containing protein n=1 Tax=Salana multivorans TaxID=120377 RepID=UPI00248F8FF6|nr:toprim domain-containing protein [Salana multivorans]